MLILRFIFDYSFMERIVEFMINKSSLKILALITVIFASSMVVPAQAGNVEYFLLKGTVYLNDMPLTAESNYMVGVSAGDESAIFSNNEYSLRVAEDQDVVSFCYLSIANLPYNSNSFYCKYYKVSDILSADYRKVLDFKSKDVAVKVSDTPNTYILNANIEYGKGKVVAGNITAPFSKAIEIEVRNSLGITESMRVFGRKFEIVIPAGSTTLTFCQEGLDCEEIDANGEILSSSGEKVNISVTLDSTTGRKLSGSITNSDGSLYKGSYELTLLGENDKYVYTSRMDRSSGKYQVPLFDNALSLKICNGKSPCSFYPLTGIFTPGKSTPKNVILNLTIKKEYLQKYAVMSGLLYSKASNELNYLLRAGRPEPGAYIVIKDNFTKSEKRYYSDENGIYTALVPQDGGIVSFCSKDNECVKNEYAWQDGSAFNTKNNNGFNESWVVPRGRKVLGDMIFDFNYQGLVSGRVFLIPDGLNVRPTVVAKGALVRTLDKDNKVIDSSSVDSNGYFAVKINDSVSKIEACNKSGFCKDQILYPRNDQSFVVEKEFTDEVVNSFPSVKAKSNIIGYGELSRDLFLNEKGNATIFDSAKVEIFTYDKEKKLLSSSKSESRKKYEFPVSMNTNYLKSCVTLYSYNALLFKSVKIQPTKCKIININPAESRYFLESIYSYPFQR